MRTDSPLAVSVLDEKPKDFCTFTIKNYDAPGGLSFRFFDRFNSLDLPYLVTGPIGKGLLHESEGVHIAFAAGTGVLTFMDLVALVARVALSTLSKPNLNQS